MPLLSSILPQILVAAFTVFKMQRSVSRLNIVGLVLVLFGAVRYTIISQRERKMREKRDAVSAGSGKKAAQPDRSNGIAASLLPITVKSPAPARGGILVNGKRSGSGKKGGDGGKDGNVGGAKAKVKGWSWWNGDSGDASRRNR